MNNVNNEQQCAPVVYQTKFAIGDEVQKVSGYSWPGVVVAVFYTLADKERIVVECTVPEVAGALHIYNPEQLQKVS